MEPKLEHFLELLKDQNFSITKISDSQESDLYFREILLYLDKKQVEGTLKGIKECKNTDQDIIIQNLTLLYPLSQHLMLKIFNEIEESDHSFVKKFDVDNMLCNKMYSILQDVKKQIGGMTSTGIGYTEKIKKLKEGIETLKADYNKQKEIVKLEKEKKEWENKTNDENIKAKIVDLKKEIVAYKTKIEKIKADNKNLEKQKNTVKEELQDLERRLDDSKQKQLLKQFLETCPKDEVDEK